MTMKPHEIEYHENRMQAMFQEYLTKTVNCMQKEGRIMTYGEYKDYYAALTTSYGGKVAPLGLVKLKGDTVSKG